MLGTWLTLLHGLNSSALSGLREIEQANHTCENSFGWSRIDRAYTNMHTADVLTCRTSCNICWHPRQMSDHSPISFAVSPQKGRAKYRCIPSWVVSHADYAQELMDEFAYLCEKASTSEGHPLHMRQLQLFKTAAWNASHHVRRVCSESVAA